MEHQLLENLQQFIRHNKTQLLNATASVIDQNISNYPIFVRYPATNELSLGLKILEDDSFSLNITTLEELSVKKIMEIEKISEFKKVYNKKNQEICVLIIDNTGHNFVFIN